MGISEPPPGFEQSDPLELRNTLQEEHGRRPTPWFRWLFDQWELPENARILELGAGAGELWQENRERISPGWQVMLSDLSIPMLQTARAATAWPALGTDGAALPFPNQHFDALLAIGLLDLIKDLPAALAEMARVLKPGGVLVASAAGRAHLAEMEALARRFAPRASLGGEPQRFGLENGQRLLRQQFDEVELRPYADEMIFEDPEPFMRYVLSEPEVAEELDEEERAELRTALEKRIQREGAVRVTVKKGLFIAR